MQLSGRIKLEFHFFGTEKDVSWSCAASLKKRKQRTHRRNSYVGHNSGGRQGPSNAKKRASIT